MHCFTIWKQSKINLNFCRKPAHHVEKKKVHPEFLFWEMERGLTLKLNIDFIFDFKN